MTVYSRNGWLHINVCGPDGKQHRKTTGTKDLAEAKLQEAAFRLELFSGQPVLEKKLSQLIAEVMADFWKNENSVRHFQGPICQSILAFFGDRRLDAVSIEDVGRYKLDRAKISETTANRSLAVLKRLFSVAVARGYVARNPVLAVPGFKEPRGRIRHLSEIEKADLLALASNWPDLADCLLVAVETGMRAGEQFGLKVGDVFLDRGYVHLLKTKSGYPRLIPITPRVREVFERLCAGKEVDRKVFGAVSFRNISRLFADLVKAVGIPTCRWHDLRHTFASNFLMRGGRLEELRDLMGHRVYATTLRYAHLSPDHLQGQLRFMSGSQETQETLDKRGGKF